MSKSTLLIFAVLCAAILVGCSKTETTENSNTATSNSNKAATAPTTTTKTEPATTASSGEKIGIPECDEFIAKYEACTNKVPEIARAQYKSAVDRWRSEWKKAAADPATKGTLAAACKQAAEQQAAAWKMYGCAN
jgi:hypothetical protein